MNYPRVLRIFLAKQRERGVPFDEAWLAALEAHTPPVEAYGWGCDEKPPRDGTTSPLYFLRLMFEKAYHRYELPGPHYTVLEAALLEVASDGAGPHRPERTFAARSTAGRCRWGGKQCRTPARRSKRFCQKHQTILNGVRERLEGTTRFGRGTAA